MIITGMIMLVVIVLRGALDVVAPEVDPMLGKYRPNLSKTKHLDLDGFFGLHPGLGDLMLLWKAGEMGFVQAVSTPYRDKRSHFDGQDLLEVGVVEVSSDARDSVWMNCMLDLIPEAKKDMVFSVGRENMLLLRGAFPTTSWAPEGRVNLSPQAQLLLDKIYSKDPLFAEAGRTAMTLAAKLNIAQMSGDNDDNADMNDMVKQMKEATNAQKAGGLAAFAAARLKEETRFATFSIGGWDTHQRQQRSIRNASRELQLALLTLKAELGPIWDKTCVLCMTEFSRTVCENGSQGTDHGTGGAMILAGGAVKGHKVYGKWPELDEADLYAWRDLIPTADLRQYAGWAVHDLFSLAKADLERDVFPNLDLGDKPKFIR